MQRKQAKIHKLDGRWVATYFVTSYSPYKRIEDITVWLHESEQETAWLFNDGGLHMIELVDCVPCDRAPGGWDCLAKIMKKDEKDSELSANINSI